VHWKNDLIPSRLTHIHGTKDWMLPAFQTADIIIKDGSHILVANKAVELSAILNELLYK
jgi:hypothetical protein